MIRISDSRTEVLKRAVIVLVVCLMAVLDLKVIERVKIQALLSEMQLGGSGLVEKDTAPKVGHLLKARHVTAGSLADLEQENLQIASVVVDAEQKENVGARQAKGELKRFWELEKQIACGIVEDLGRDCDTMPEAFGKIHTKSMPALLAYSEGLGQRRPGQGGDVNHCLCRRSGHLYSQL